MAATNTPLQTIFLSYLYQQYSDDDDLQAFICSYNGMAQTILDWFVSINLPIYTGTMISGPLLDWVAQGLYGIERPTLISGSTLNIGTLNTYTLNSIELNTYEHIGPQIYYVTNDDIFKRIITWHFYKGDGKVFNVRWLKRRIMRFLIGANGTAPNIDSTYQISITFGVGNQVNIGFITKIRTITGGSMLNYFALNSLTPLNSITSTLTSLPPLPNAHILVDAINSGAVELPFQYAWVVSA